MTGLRRRNIKRDGSYVDEQSTAISGFVTVGVRLSLLLLVTFCAQLPGGATPRWLERQRAYGILWPQGWFFYSQVSRHEVVVVYSVSNDGHLRLRTQPQAAPGRLWGIRQSGAAELIEIGDIYNHIPKDYWAPCDHLAVETCWTLARGHEYQLVNNDPRPSFCGHVLFVVEAPVRWRVKHDARDSRPAAQRIAAADLACGR